MHAKADRMVYNMSERCTSRTMQPPSLRANLRIETRDVLRRRLIEGRLVPGANVVERELSKELGVSRTPLREALLGLEVEGLLRSEPQRGFFVQELSIEDARELYQLIGLLEAFSVENGKPPANARLVRLNEKFGDACTPAEAIQCDRDWHEELIHQCRVPRAASILGAL